MARFDSIVVKQMASEVEQHVKEVQELVERLDREQDGAASRNGGAQAHTQKKS